MDSPQELASDQPVAIEDRNGTSSRKSKKEKKKKNKKLGGSTSALQKDYQVAGSEENTEGIGAPEQNPAEPTPVSELSEKKRKRKRQKSNHNTHDADPDANGQEAGSEEIPVGESDLRTEETLELANTKHSNQKRKNRKSHQEQLQTGDEDSAPKESLVAAQLADTEHQDGEAETDPIPQEDKITTSGSKPRHKKHKSRTAHSASIDEEDSIQSKEPEHQADSAHAKEKSKKKKKKSKLEKAVVLEAAKLNEEAQEAHSIEALTSIGSLDNYPADQVHLPKSNSGKRKKLQQSLEETSMQDQDTESHVSEKPKTKKNIAKPKTQKTNQTEAGDANSAALLNQFVSARKNSRSEPKPAVPSAKALGKRPALDESVERQSKKRKQIDSDPRNGDIRSMFSDDAPQNRNLSVPASKADQRTRLSLHNVGSSPAVKTGHSANQEIAGWTGANRRSASAGNNQESSGDDSEFELEEQSDEPSVSRRKRYLPVDEPSLVALETPKSSKKQKQSKSEKSSTKKRGKGKAGPSSEVKSKRSRSQSARDGNRRLDGDDTTKIADAVELYRVDNDIDQHAVNSIIQGNALTDGKKFWDFMVEEVPDVPKRNLQSWCRRNFHNFAARGVWTTEQDEELMEVFNRLPKKWSLIGAELNRLPDDCRDRWRNYLSVTNLELGPWKLEEEQQLRGAVKKCIELIREDRRREGLLTPEEEDDDTYHEHHIDWMKISELMDLSRSHLQCYRKWKAIKTRENATTDDLVAERIVISNSWKHLKNYQEATQTLAAEKLQFLRAIRDSKAGAESKIDWIAIDKKLDRNHDAMEMRICLRGLLQNIVGHTSKPLQENVKLLIKAFEDSAPHEPEGYVDLPFESTGLKKRTRKSKTSSLFENNPQLYDVGSSSSKSKMRHRMLKQDKSRGNHNSTTNTDDGQLSDTIQVPDSAKKTKRAASVKKSTKTFALSTERVMDSESEDDAPTSAQKPMTMESESEDDAPTSAQKPRSDSEDEDLARARSNPKQMPRKKKGHRAVRSEIVEDGSDDEQEPQPESDSNSGSDEDSEMEDADEPQIAATPEYQLQEGYSQMSEQHADLDEAGQVNEMDEDDVEDDDESIMDDMSDIPATIVKKTSSPSVNGEDDVYFGREASVELDQ